MIYRNYLHTGHMCVYQLYKVFYSDNLPKVHICNLQLIISIRPSVIRENFLQPLLLSEVTNVDTTLVYTYILSLLTRGWCPSLVTSNLFFDLGCGKVWFNQINLESMKYPDKCSPDLFDYLSHTKMKMAMLCGWQSCEMSGVDSVFGQREFAFQRGEGRERGKEEERREKWHLARQWWSTWVMMLGLKCGGRVPYTVQDQLPCARGTLLLRHRPHRKLSLSL